MKKILLISMFLSSLNIYAVTAKSEMYDDRGLELMREANFYQLIEIARESGSLQTVESYFEKSKDVKSKGFLLGTVSNFTDIPNIHVGLTVAYQKYKFKEENSKDREYALNTYFSYRKKNYLFIGGLAYSQARNVEKRRYSGDFEIGKFSKNYNFNTFDRGKLYYYVALISNKWKHRHLNNARFINYRLGLSSYHFIERFRFVGNIEVNADNKKYDKNRGKYNFSFSYAVGYQIYDDLLVELRYKGIKNKKFYNNLISLGFTHNF